MAPSFFSKLVKPQSSSRHSSDRDDLSRSSSSPPTSPVPTISVYSGSTHARTLSTASTPSGLNPTFQLVQSSPSPSHSSLSSEPNVTVIPPSPRSYAGSFQSQSDTDAAPTAPDKTEKERGTHNRPPALVNLNNSSTTETDSGMPTPMPTANKSLGVNGNARPLTPSSSTGNLRDRVRSVVSRSSSRSRSRTNAEPPAPAPPLPSVSPHATTVGHEMHHVADPQAQTQPPTKNGSNPALSIVPPGPGESITGVNEFQASPTSADPRTTHRAFTLATSNPAGFPESQLLSPDRVRDSDSVSIASTASGRKRRLWRRSSTVSTAQASPKRKPTGLASALVASVSSSGGVRRSPSPNPTGRVSPPASPPRRKNSKVKRSPALSGHHVATSQSSIDSNVLQLSPQAIRPRHNSLSVRTQGQESDYASSADGNEDDNEDDSEDDELLAELNDGDIPVTGFAVASNKRNADFHELFRTIPEGDYLIEDYGCALQREILVQGRIYISENHICFHANIFGWVTDLIVPIYDIVSLEKKMTAFVIPNAIQITTRTTKYTFASFLARDTAYDVIYNIWRLARPEDGLSEDEQIGRTAMDATLTQTPDSVSPNESGTMSIGPMVVQIHKVTFCACGRDGKHYSESVLDTVLPGTPERIYNLMFASGFLKDFMRDNQKLEDIQISDWAPIPGDPSCLARNMSYIKHLSASIGPKSTKCEIRDETLHSDIDDYISTVTTTRNPDVPSGGVFSVKSRTCIMWASTGSSRVIVTSQVEWTGRSFIRGIIEKSAMEGQRTYQRDLESSMRNYIQEHQSEFIPAGLDPAAVAVAVQGPVVPMAPTAVLPPTPLSEEAARKEREKEREQERNQRGLQWAYDTFEGAFSVGRQSATGAIELIRDAWDQSSTSTILYFVIAFLVLSNLWTLMLVGNREEVGRRKEMRRTEEREKWVQGVVTALWEELAAGRHPGAAPPFPVTGALHASGPTPANAHLPESWREEVAKLSGALDAVEERVRFIRQSLAGLD